jgi:glycosyltransferase involved in cell wall biosynthesis
LRVGECLPGEGGYLQQLLALPHVHHVGALAYDDPLLPSAYAAAGVMALVSQSEVMPLSVLESLAAGRPAVMTRHHCMDMGGLESRVAEVEPADERSIRAAVDRTLQAAHDVESCRRLVRHLTWDAVAGELIDIYAQAGGRDRPSA